MHAKSRAQDPPLPRFTGRVHFDRQGRTALDHDPHLQPLKWYWYLNRLEIPEIQDVRLYEARERLERSARVRH